MNTTLLHQTVVVMDCATITILAVVHNVGEANSIAALESLVLGRFMNIFNVVSAFMAYGDRLLMRHSHEHEVGVA